MTVEIEPSPLVGRLITKLEEMGLVEGMNAAMERASEFGSSLEARLTGIALDPLARPVADRLLDEMWAAENAVAILSNSSTTVEVVVGSGFHAAVYAATRVRRGFPRPLVLERNRRVGGVFADAGRATFYLNSRNRPGGPGLAGDLGASLNHLPGGIIQATNVSMGEYQTNADMGFVIRLTLAQYATVLPRVEVVEIDPDGDVRLSVRGDGDTFFCGRVILARGLGDPVAEFDPGEFVVSFPDFMRRMAEPWPLRGLRRVAVIGDGDSGKCAVEALLGLGPQGTLFACAALDHVERVDWYATSVPTTCEEWQSQIRGRYQGIGRYLRSDRFGVARLNVVNRFGIPSNLPDCAVIDGRSYDLVVACLGNERQGISGGNPTDPYRGADNEIIAKFDDEREVYSVGPEAGISFSRRERADGIADINANEVAMFRTGTKTALLAAMLDAPRYTD